VFLDTIFEFEVTSPAWIEADMSHSIPIPEFLESH
jgi:hypothetical protein